MEKPKRWQLFTIIAVIVLTLFNILPTIFYYMQPLKEPIGKESADVVAANIVQRVNSLEEDSQDWLRVFCDHLGMKPESIVLDEMNPRLFEVTFKSQREARLFQRLLPAAGAQIPFAPAQMTAGVNPNPEASQTVVVERKLGVKLDSKELDTLFQFAFKFDQEGRATPEYRRVVYDRAVELVHAFAGNSDNAAFVKAIVENSVPGQTEEIAVNFAKNLADYSRNLSQASAFLQRYYKSFAQHSLLEKDWNSELLNRLGTIRKAFSEQESTITSQQNELREKGKFLDSSKQQALEEITRKVAALDKAIKIIEQNRESFCAGSSPLTRKAIREDLEAGSTLYAKSTEVQTLNIGNHSPFVKEVFIDWGNDSITIRLHDDLVELRDAKASGERAAILKEKLEQTLINEMARVSRNTEEEIAPSFGDFTIQTSALSNSESFLIFDLGSLASTQAKSLQERLNTLWAPEKGDLKKDQYPVMDYKTFKSLPAQQSKLGLVVYVPAIDGDEPIEGFRADSIYVIARGLYSIAEKHQSHSDSPEAQEFSNDFSRLNELLKQDGFFSYPGFSFGLPKEFSHDFIFELNQYYDNVVGATREEFKILGSKRFAMLEFTDGEQRILTRNQINRSIHEDLLKWRDRYNSAQVASDLSGKLQVPPPSKNAFVENLKLNAYNYFRGDERKILRWGLDLSGGKTVLIGLLDQNNRPVTDEADINQAVNELYKRVNRLGVSEINIRSEGNNIRLDFPGSQSLSAADLVKASAMYLHVVNEKFSLQNPDLGGAVNTFFQEVWNEAVVTNRKDAESINQIAWKQLGGDTDGGNEVHPRTEHAKTLVKHGLVLQNPYEQKVGNAFNDTVSKVGVYRGEEPSDWNRQSHPLLFVFSNYALEGASLTNINAGYDPSHGNTLYFQVQSSYAGDRSGNPRDDFHVWTSEFAQDRIVGTPKEELSGGRGWRLAVILNGQVINDPHLKSALKDGGSITGNFSQREVNELASDLKAGSLSFTPSILSERNVSAELGHGERTRGIMAALVGLVLVVAVMVGYYRFAGVVASIAVLFNLLIMWGVLQNLEAIITLPGIAGIILTVGMAVDANVLVFERIREEFSHSGRIASAVQVGYKKAFTAIIDSNITTIMAALILLNFDSGPIKGFAVTIIVGIASSMFTALFMTRYFFGKWAMNKENKELKMADVFGKPNFNFLKKAKTAFAVSFAIVAIGGGLFFSQNQSIFGMDFTGGYALTLELEETSRDVASYRDAVAEAFEESGAVLGDFKIQELNAPNNLFLQFGMGMEEPGRPFHELSTTSYASADGGFSYEKNPYLVWIVKSLESKGLRVKEEFLPNLESSWTIMGKQFSESMRDSALMGMGLALLAILVYITMRFEFKFAISSIAGLAHDILLTIAILVILNVMGVSVQITLQVVGAIMTIIGYSLNDTIIVFDRIREDSHTYRKLSFTQVINQAINVTLNRTILTSGTTLCVLFALVVFGGELIFDFALVMTLGVLIGTFSSLFIVAPIMLYFHNRELVKSGEVAVAINS